MARETSSVAIEDLLAQRAWVRALAGTLVRGDAAADDLAQEAWVAALRSPPRSGTSVRAWFASVLRNAARMQHRGDVRRDRREAASARPEGTGDTADVVARAEEHGRVVRAVLTLDEPYRTAVLLRFFDELPPREIARRTGAPVETVRSQIRRALERLRAHLDAEHGADGETWRAALLPLAGLRAAGAPWGGAGGGASPVATGSSMALKTGAIAMGAKAVLVATVVAAAVGAAAGWFAGAPDRTEMERLRGVEADVADARDQAKSWREKHDQARRELEAQVRDLDTRLREKSTALDAAQQEAAKLQEQLAAAAADATETPAPAETAKAGPPFAYPEYEDAFSKIDWKAIAEHMSAMPPLISEVALALRDGTTIPAQAAGDIQRHNGPLVTTALQLNGTLPGTGPNGTFTHPAFMVNAMAIVLEQAGKPLDAAQRVALEEVGRRFSNEDDRRLRGYDDSTFQIRKVSEEGDLRARFFTAARKVLTPAQLETLSPELTRDRITLDIWSAGIFWAQFARPVAIDDEGKFVDEVTRLASRALKLGDGELSDRARVIVADWTSRLPESIRARKPDSLERAGRIPSATVQASSVEMRRLVERLVNDLALEGDSLTAAKGLGVILVPMPGAEE